MSLHVSAVGLGESQTHLSRTSRWTRGAAALLAVLLAGASAVVLAVAPALAGGGVTTTVTLNGQQYDGTPVVTEGDTLIMRVQYGVEVAGSTVSVELGGGFELGVLPNSNDAVTKIEVDPANPKAVLLTFADPWPSDVNQGVLELAFKVSNVNQSEFTQLTWTVDGAGQSIDVIVKDAADTLANVQDGQGKYAGWSDINSFVTYDRASGTVTLAPGVIGRPIPYTLWVNSKGAQAGYTISDQLPAGMIYGGTFSAVQTTWDPKGLNRTTAPISFAPTVVGNAFVAALDLPGPSQTTITYDAMVADEAARAAIERELQASADAVVTAENGGYFSHSLVNTATFGPTAITQTGTVTLGQNVPGLPGPNVGAAFKKTSDWTSKDIVLDDGALASPVDIAYSFAVDLTPWDGTNAKKTLTRNVVVSDHLPAQALWNVGAVDFLTQDGLPFPLAAFPGGFDAAAFAGDAYVGTYFVDGQKLMINVGRTATTQATITAKAQVTTVDGLWSSATNVPGETAYWLTNRGKLTYASVNPAESSNTVTLVTRTSANDGANDSSAFNKKSSPSTVVVNPGESAEVVYTFEVGGNKGIDLTKSKVVDYVDADVFDLSNLAGIRSGITATYDWWRVMDAADFDLTQDGDGNLVIALSPDGAAKVTSWGLDKRLVLSLPLRTHTLTGKETLRITNKATLFGEDGTALFWSQVVSEATSYGDEAEVRKRIRDTSNGGWTENLRAEVDANGDLLQELFVYQVTLDPRGAYDNVSIIDVVDRLPAGIEFVGFVADDHVDDGAGSSTGVRDLVGNVQARFDGPSPEAPQGTVTLFQKPGTKLDASQGDPSVNILVRITDFTVDEAIVNTIGTTSATITPTEPYALTINKVDAVDPSKVITDLGARFQILDSADAVVVDDVFVVDGVLRVSVAGTTTSVKVSGPGVYTVKEITAPAGYVLSAATVDATVTMNGTSSPVTFYNTPVGTPVGMVSVGDSVWVDSDRDGRQDIGEQGIQGVVVEVTGPGGGSVLDVHGAPVGSATTDANGTYTFVGLPVLTGGQSYTVTVDRVASAGVLKPYVPTAPGQGDHNGDSSEWSAASTGLTQDGDSDPTLDFGFVLKTYAIGDVTWTDTSGDGVQDSDEPVLPGVTVTLLDSAGNPVPGVGAQVTDGNGRYLFDRLPAGHYRMKFEMTGAQVARYAFTQAGAGGHTGLDSDVDPVTGLGAVFVLDDSNASLTLGYADQAVVASQGIDPTWDAGVVLKWTAVVRPPGETVPPVVTPPPGESVPPVVTAPPGEGARPEPTKEAQSAHEGDSLATTGAAVAAWSAGALALISLGAGLVLVRTTVRRHT